MLRAPCGPDLPGGQARGGRPLFDPWMCSVYDVQKRFGRWDELLAEPAPSGVPPDHHGHLARLPRDRASRPRRTSRTPSASRMAFREAMKAIPEDAAWETYGTAR